LPITRHSGRKGLANKLKELGIHFDKDEVNTIYDAIQKVIGEKKFITDSDLLRVVSRFKNK
jgi:isopropylmalate/homocitrate/citramalate synthase